MKALAILAAWLAGIAATGAAQAAGSEPTPAAIVVLDATPLRAAPRDSAPRVSRRKRTTDSSSGAASAVVASTRAWSARTKPPRSMRCRRR